jgi:flagellar biosynthesis chaperone FliJ
MADPLATLRRLRRLEVDGAHRDLAEKLAAAREAEQRAGAARTALRTEAQAAPRDAAHPLARGFSNWLPVGQNAARTTAASERAAHANAEASRAALAEARAAERAVETVQDARAAARRVTVIKREQITLDDFKAREN